MTRLTQFYATTTLATLLTTSTAMADVTALQVWDDWQSLMARTGAQVDFEQSSSDGILTINNLSFTTKPQGSDGATEVNLGSLVFQEQNDGSVVVLLPTDAPIVVSNDNNKVILNQSHKDLSLVVSGAPKDLTYSYKAAALSLALVELMVAGKKVVDATADVTLSDLNGTTHARNANLIEMTQDVTIGTLSYRLDFDHVEEETKVSSQGSVTDLQNSFSVAIPENMDTLEIQDALKSGFKAIGHISYSNIGASLKMTQEDDVTDATVSFENGALDMSFDKGENGLGVVSQNIAFGPIKLQTDINIRDKEKTGLLDFAIDQLGAGFTVNLPYHFAQDVSEQESFQMAMDAGLSITANAGYDGVSGEFSMNKDGQSYAGNAISATAGFDLSLDRDSVRYTGSVGYTNMALTGPDVPIGPLEFAVSEMRTNLVAPLNVSKIPAPFSYHDRIINLSVSENLWAMFDPDKLLPRGVATYILDFEGMANWLTDPFTEEFQDEDSDQPKGELHSLTLNELQLSVAGADLTGAGAFTYNNDDLETYDGFPAPTGTLDLKILGLNKLMDTLVQIGLLEEDEAFGARMGLGLFTVAGDGDDTLVSHIEATDDGHVLANGKRLK